MRSTMILFAALWALTACDDGADQRAEIRQRALERAGDDIGELCRLVHAHPETPEAESAEEMVAQQLAGWEGRLAAARESRRVHPTFRAWLEGVLTAQAHAACTPLTVRARIHFERTEENAESSVQQSVERAVEAALDGSDRQTMAVEVAEAIDPLTQPFVNRSAAVRVGEDEPNGTIIDIDVRLEGSDFLTLAASTTLTLRQEGGTTTGIELPVVVLPRESVDPHRSRRTSDASNLTMDELLRRVRRRIVDGLGLNAVDAALEPYAGEWGARLGSFAGVCAAPDVDVDADLMTINPGGRTLAIGGRTFDVWVDGEELLAERHWIGGPCRSRVSEILRIPARPEGELSGRWSATFDGDDDCERSCTRSANITLTRRME